MQRLEDPASHFVPIESEPPASGEVGEMQRLEDPASHFVPIESEPLASGEVGEMQRRGGEP
ncbi:hypothetical protein [Castellaniella daejeonensis]